MENKEQSIPVYKLLYTHEEIYLPPQEKSAIPLEVGLGCSWHRCKFCDFTRDTFCIHSGTKIANSLSLLAQMYPNNQKIFFLGENIFCLPPDKLHALCDLTEAYLPNVREIAMYSRADDVLRKTPEELRDLRARGICRLHMGLESGSDPILHMMNKGISSQQFLEAFRRLDEAGIDYYLTMIPGLGGRTFSTMHAIETANLLNQCHPKEVWCLKLHLYEGTELYEMYRRGEFDWMTPLEVLKEEYLMMQRVESEFRFIDSTVLNEFTIIGDLPQQKEDVLKTMRYMIERYEAQYGA